MLEGILCILGPREEAVPAVLVVMTVGPEISPNLLNLSLSLAISLGVIPRGDADGDMEELEESLPDTGYKLWSTVRDNIFWDAEGVEEIMEEGLCCFEGSG